MANHTSQFMRVHGSILAFTQQGLEKFNDTMTKDYFRATCHRNEQALVQILQKRNRMEHMKDMDTVRAKHHAVSCSFCGKEGHNRLTCSTSSYITKTCLYCNHFPILLHKSVISCINNNIAA